MPQMIAAPTFQLPQLQAFSGGAQTTEAAANLANQLLSAYMKKLEMDKGKEQSQTRMDMLIDAISNKDVLNPDYIDSASLIAEPDLTQVPEEQRLSTGAVPVEQALGFRAEQGPTSGPLAEALLRPRVEPDPSMLPAIPNIDGTMPVASSAAPQYGEAPTMPPEVAAPPRTTEQIQKDLRVIPEVDTAALPKVHKTSDGTIIDMNDPNIDREYTPSPDTARERFLTAYQEAQAAGADLDFSNMGPMEQQLFEEVMAKPTGTMKIITSADEPRLQAGTVALQQTGPNGELLGMQVLQEAPAVGDVSSYFAQVDLGNGDVRTGRFTEAELLNYTQQGAIVTATDKGGDTNVEVNLPGGVEEGEYAKAAGRGRAEALGKEYDAIRDDALSGAQVMRIMGQLPPNDAAFQGKLKGFKKWYTEAMDAAGFTLSDKAISRLEATQTYDAVIASMLKDLLATQKGPQTDADAARLAAILPILDNTPNAIRWTKELLVAASERQLERKKFYDRWYNEHPMDGSVDGKRGYEGADEAWREHTNRTPVVVWKTKEAEDGKTIIEDAFTFYEFRNSLLYKETEMVDSDGQATGQLTPPIMDLRGRITNLPEDYKQGMIEEKLDPTDARDLDRYINLMWQRFAEGYA